MIILSILRGRSLIEINGAPHMSNGALEFDHAGRYGFLIRYAYGPHGIID